jgi:hypothetical protein
MQRHMSPTEAFAAFGVRPKSPKSKSARCEKFGIVVVHAWEDELMIVRGRLVYVKTRSQNWRDNLVMKEFLDHLLWALMHARGVVRLVLSTRKNGRRLESFPLPSVAMIVRSIHFVDGEFWLEEAFDGRGYPAKGEKEYTEH